MLAGALGGGLALGAVPLLSGCGSAASEDRLRVAFAGGGSRENLDPHVVLNYVDQARAKACFDTLTGWSEEMGAVPRLAESWEVDPTGMRWRIRLRETRFHDGRPLTPDDVLATFCRIADPATGATAAKLFTTVDLTASRALGPRDVEVVLTAPNFLFPLSWAAPGTEIVPQGTTSFARPIGTGPFRWVSFTPGGPALYAANPAYWGGAPPSRELEFVPVDEEQARVGALLSGQVAYAFDLRASSAVSLGTDSRTRVLSAPGSASQFLYLRVDRPPFSDPRLREAVTLGLDREALVRVALLGKGQVGNDLFGQGAQYYDTSVPQVTRDVERAGALVGQAGATGSRIELQTSTSDPIYQAAAGVIAQQLGEIGLQVVPRTVPPDSYYATIRSQGVSSVSSVGSLPLPDYIGRRMVSSATARNFTGYRDPQIDALSAAAVATSDEPARIASYARAQELIRASSGMLVWAAADNHVGIAAELGGVLLARPNTDQWARFDRARLG
ncbi:ABC transporter substrate-binding protein [Actinomycetospora sp.]|uniref:ABC transporter substrate-binding protein n=1 Tax=Actinomycetospora sp. TaxID=1872135 RepID=UPI002F402202